MYFIFFLFQFFSSSILLFSSASFVTFSVSAFFSSVASPFSGFFSGSASYSIAVVVEVVSNSNLSLINSNQNLEAGSSKFSLKSNLELCNIVSLKSLPDPRKKKAPGTTLVKKAKSSLALTGRWNGPTLSSPKNFLATLSTC